MFSICYCIYYPSDHHIIIIIFTAPGSPPLNISLIPQSPYTITITWLPPAQPNGYITQYTIRINYMNTTVMSVNVSVPSTQYTVTGLSPYQSIVVQVSAWTIGEGPISESVSGRTLQTGLSCYKLNKVTCISVPGQVIDIILTPLSESVLLVSFSNQPLSVANGVILHYEMSIVQYTGENNLKNTTVDANDTIEVIFSGLSKLYISTHVLILYSAFNTIQCYCCCC